jgi:replicative DNA helicase
MHQELFKAIKFNYEKHNLVDIVILRSYLQDKNKLAQTGGIQYIIELTNSVPTSANFKSYEETIKTCSTRRQLISQAKRVENASYE